MAVAGGRRAWLLLAVTVAAVAFGTALLLLALSVPGALQAASDRTAWLDSASLPELSAQSDTRPATTYSVLDDNFGDAEITVVSVAGNAPDAPVPPGLERLPAPGQAYVSRPLAHLLDQEPLLAGRYGDVIGVLGESGVAGPDALVAVRGVPPEEAALIGLPVSGFARTGTVLELQGVLRVLLFVGTAGLLAPVALFASMSTRLSAASRERRLARLRLLGATIAQVRSLASVEAGLAGLAGGLLGVVLFVATRPATSRLSNTGGRWFTTDLDPGLIGGLLTLALVVAVTLAAAQITLRQVGSMPLQVSADVRPDPLSRRSLILAFASAAVLALLLGTGQLSQSTASVVAFTALVAVLLLAGPWLSQFAGRLLARLPLPAALIAGRRLVSDPRSGFGAVAAVVVGVLVTTLFAATTPAAVASLDETPVVGANERTGQAQLDGVDAETSAQLARDVKGIEGVTAAALVYTGLIENGAEPLNIWFGDCAEIAAAARMGSVPCGRAPLIVAENYADLLQRPALNVFNLDPLALQPIMAAPDANGVRQAEIRPGQATTMPAQEGVDVPAVIADPSVAPGLTAQLRPDLLVFAYDDPVALEQARTLVVRLPGTDVRTRQTSLEGFSGSVRQLYRVLAVATAALAVIATVGLVIAMVVGLIERRRSFALLRAAGTPVAVLRRSLVLEALLPLTVMAAVAGLAGAGAGAAITRNNGFAPAWSGLWPPLLGGMVLAVLIILPASAVVDRATRTEETRFE